MNDTKACLSIAAADCAGGNGCLSDIKTFTALGVYGCACVTAIAVQNGGGMRNLESLSSHLITNQLIAVIDEMKIDAIKIGLCPSIQNIHSVSRFLREHPDIPVIIDPVAVDAGGLIMLAPESIDAVCNELIPRADLLTPNMREAAILEKHTAIKRGLTQVREFLKNSGFKYRKTAAVPGRIAKDGLAEEQDEFKKNELEPLLDEAENGAREVFFWTPPTSFTELS